MEDKAWQDEQPASVPEPRIGKRQKALVAAIAAVTALAVEVLELPAAVEGLLRVLLLGL